LGLSKTCAIATLASLLILSAFALPTVAKPLSTPEEVIIGLKGKIPRSLTSDLALYGASKIAWDSGLRFVVVRTQNPETFMAKMKTKSYVAYVEYDWKASTDLTPNDPAYSRQWGLASIFASSAWDTTQGSKNVVIAVMDTGIDYNHPDLKGNIWRAPDGSCGYDFVNSDNDPKDDNGHGTHVAGIAAATIQNSIGIAGISQTSLMAVKVLDSTGVGSYSAIANGIKWAADHGARVISMSLGGVYSSSTLSNAVAYAWNKGCLLVASAGNTGGSVMYPAACEQVIAVSALASGDYFAGYSARGSKIELSAPGSSVYSTMPTFTVYMNSKYGVSTSYAYLSGTSMAAPHVSGVAALVWSASSSLTNQEVRNLLDRSACDLGSAGRDTYFGYGKVNAQLSVSTAKGMATSNPDFAVSLSPSAMTVERGATGASRITISSIDGFSSEVKLFVNDLVGVTLSFSSNPVTPLPGSSCRSDLTISVSSSALSGNWAITVTGQSDSRSHSTQLALNITDSGAPISQSRAPSPPQNLRVSTYYGSVKLTWSPPAYDGGSPLTSYKVYRGTTSGGESYRKSTTTCYTTEWGLLRGIRYYYYVTAVNADGESAPSNEVSVVP